MSKLIFGKETYLSFERLIKQACNVGVNFDNVILIVETNFEFILISHDKEAYTEDNFILNKYIKSQKSSEVLCHAIKTGTFHECLSEFNHIISQLDK